MKNKLGWFALFVLVALPDCGKLPTTGCSNDAAPTSGTISAQGSFAAGGSVSGSVTIYDLGGGTYLLRLSNLTAPSESAIYVQVVANSTTVYTSALKSSCGSQNYYMTPSSTSFQQVKIHSTTKNTDYGVAAVSTG